MAPDSDVTEQREPAWYRVALRTWRSGGGVLPTTRDGAEIAVIATVVCWRIITLALILVAVPDAFAHSSRIWIDVTLLSLVVVESAVAMVRIIRCRNCISLRWAVTETVLGVACLLAEPLYVPVDDRVSTWVGWAPALAVNVTVTAAVACRRSSHTLMLVGLLATAYVAVSYPAVGQSADRGTVVSNTLTYLAFGLLVRGMANMIRRFGRDADEARDAASEARAQVELERHRRLLHDPASLLRYLADPDLDPRLAGVVREQALAEANRIRAFLDPEHTVPGSRSAADGETSTLLADAARAAAAGFTDLPIELVLHLADGVQLSPPASRALTAATATVLHNVRRHAGPGASVVVHGDHHPGDGSWEITIRDDGQGFDPSRTAPGYGLREVVGTALAEHGMSSHIHSQPGNGTTVTIRGAAR
ncbi:ATP-binding protein [Streptacidiphilus cavernicola]|uniref:ATP-binding protein n=1 Tax=Streptacidiphilus cavernicola TaxID=3342716 RepID=A0ABV6VY60_9ACTN